MAYIEIYDLANASSFRNRLIPAITQIAGTVLSEESTGRISYDNKRKDLARRVLRDPSSLASDFVWSVLSNPSIAASGIEASDGDIAYQVTQVWSTIAGVTSADLEAPVNPPAAPTDPEEE